jgi:HAD superfamily 5'-nucleotidase-like hydrolase
MPTPPTNIHPRGLFSNRTLNLRSIKAIGYDMDYTLIHYRIDAWERRAYEYLRVRLKNLHWPVEDLQFDPDLVIRGLIVDTKLGNLLKVNRFGYVKAASHGTTPLTFEEQRKVYAQTVVDLAEERWVFLNTFFSLSEASMYAQLVDRLDARRLPEVLGYGDLYRRVKSELEATHVEGALKAEIIASPERFIELDGDTPLALLDQKQAGKRLLLVTNSEWSYTQAMMRYAFDRFLPGDMTWVDLFELVIVGARKPDFFTTRSPVFQLVNDQGLVRPLASGIRTPGLYLGGDATNVERYLELAGDQILYIGDHIWGDVHVSKSLLRWRTALILRELEGEIVATQAFRARETVLEAMMRDKAEREQALCTARLALQRLEHGRELPAAALELLGPLTGEGLAAGGLDGARRRISDLREEIVALDERLAPLAKAAAELGNPRWGLLLRAGNDKSHLARQVERSADVYTSRVSNFLWATPYVFLRSPRGALPHDPPLERADDAP